MGVLLLATGGPALLSAVDEGAPESMIEAAKIIVFQCVWCQHITRELQRPFGSLPIIPIARQNPALLYEDRVVDGCASGHVAMDFNSNLLCFSLEEDRSPQPQGKLSLPPSEFVLVFALPMLRKVHLVIGIVAVVAFLLSGQVLGHHHPRMEQLSAELRMMYVSRHIYLLTAALVNTVLGVYLQLHPSSWRRSLQLVGSLLILASVFSLALAFIVEPPLGMAGRSWRSYVGLIALFAGVMTHLAAKADAPGN